jgi:hypothetical protein
MAAEATYTSGGMLFPTISQPQLPTKQTEICDSAQTKKWG